MCGDGVYHWACGEEYVGEFVDDAACGVGTYTWPDGHEYCGDYLDDRMHGQGRLRYPGGAMFEGDFTAGRQQGHGVLTWPQGHRLTGLTVTLSPVHSHFVVSIFLLSLESLPGSLAIVPLLHHSFLI